MNIPMEQETFGLLVAILFFLISFLVNLLQHRYSRARLGRMLTKEESFANSLAGIHKYLGELEWNCTIELHGASSPQEVGKAIHVARDRIDSTIAEMKEYLHSFRQYRKKERAREKQMNQLEKSRQRPGAR